MTRRVPLSRQYHGTHWETNWGNLPKYVRIDPMYRLQANLNPALKDKIPCDQLVLRRCPPMTPNNDVNARPSREYNPCHPVLDPCKNLCCDIEVNILVYGDDDAIAPQRGY